MKSVRSSRGLVGFFLAAAPFFACASEPAATDDDTTANRPTNDSARVDASVGDATTTPVTSSDASQPCVSSCSGKTCGSDGCGGSCGTCAGSMTCTPTGTCMDVKEDCSTYPYRADTLLAERVGYGANATGGDPAHVYHVTTLDGGSGPGTLRAALESTDPNWIVFDVNGKISFGTDRVHVTSNKTVDGRGRDIDIEGHLQLRDVKNVILSDVRLENSLEGHCTQKGDVLSVDQTDDTDAGVYTTGDIWMNHLEVFNGGDGLVDLTGGTNYTMSWCHLHMHKKGLLWKAPDIKVTVHHTFFDRISLRGPQFLWGHMHFFNNYQYQWYEYGAGSLGGAQFYSEQNIYEARPGTICLPVSCPDPNPCGDSDWQVSKKALVTDWDTNGTGYTKSVGDLTVNDAVLSINSPNMTYDPKNDYSYTAEVATPALADAIKNGAGPRVKYCQGM